jgi:uncharacterized protein (DUF433 family)
MTDKILKQRIEIDPKKLQGKPVIRGTRVSVEQVLALMASGVEEKEILIDFPQLKKEDLLAAVQYAANIVHDSKAYPREYLEQIHV